MHGIADIYVVAIVGCHTVSAFHRSGRREYPWYPVSCHSNDCDASAIRTRHIGVGELLIVGDNVDTSARRNFAEKPSGLISSTL